MITILAYVALVLMLRVSGNRTLSKMNAFDLIVTITLGSCLSAIALNKNVPLFDGGLVFFLLIFLQFVITWLSARSTKVKKLVTGDPALLVYKGKMLHNILKQQRISEEEIYLAARKNGFSSISNIYVIVIGTNGTFSVIGSSDIPGATSLKEVKGFSPSASYMRLLLIVRANFLF